MSRKYVIWKDNMFVLQFITYKSIIFFGVLVEPLEDPLKSQELLIQKLHTLHAVRDILEKNIKKNIDR